MGKDFYNLPKIFKLFPKNKRILLFKFSKKKLENILDYKKIIQQKKIKKISIMIAMHNFYDSPHVFGKCFFQIFF